MRRRGSPILLRLLAFSFPYWRIVIVAQLCVFGAAAFMVLMPIFVQIAIEGLKSGRPSKGLADTVQSLVGFVREQAS